MTDVVARLHAPPGDLLRLASDEPLVFELAERLWEPARADAADAANAIRIEILHARHSPRKEGEEEEEEREDFSKGAGRREAKASGSPRGAPSPSFSFEKNLRWVHEPHRFRCEVPGALDLTIDFARARVVARMDPILSLLLSKKSSSSLSSFLARTLLEAPAAVLLGRRGWQVLHAGAVVGPRGAAVLRGPSGAGKSTLVAAALGAGLDVLGDESLFVSRADPDQLAASVRDLALREDSARLLGVFHDTEPAFTGREVKCRVDLFNGSTPRARTARRAATVLLGPREPGPARLAPCSGEPFLDAFRAGEIPQERFPGDPDAVARAWAGDGGFFLSGSADLAGAVRLMKGLVT
ncbi:MAG TPA: hypothetical protein VMN04_02950 [Thermoanaerobaculia bacterium]|nr:hypothetical protein [Thermoanaerobaculia bacterium]